MAVPLHGRRDGGEFVGQVADAVAVAARGRFVELAQVGVQHGVLAHPLLQPGRGRGDLGQGAGQGAAQQPLAAIRAGQAEQADEGEHAERVRQQEQQRPVGARDRRCRRTGRWPSSMAASHPVTTHSRNAICASISRSDGHALDGENDNAKITASPVSRVAKNAMLNWTESITSPRLSGVTMATISRMTAQADRAARRGLSLMPLTQLTAGAARRRARAQARNAGSLARWRGHSWLNSTTVRSAGSTSSGWPGRVTTRTAVPSGRLRLLPLVGGGDPGRHPGPRAAADDRDVGGWFAHERADAAGGDDQALAAQRGQRVPDRVAADAEGLRQRRLGRERRTRAAAHQPGSAPAGSARAGGTPARSWPGRSSPHRR